MPLIDRFEDLQAWRHARLLTQQAYKIAASKPFCGYYSLRSQIQRAAVSGMANLAEGFDCESKHEFGRFLGIARRSIVEVQSLLYVAADLGYIDQGSFSEIYEQARKTKALIGGLKRSLTRHT